MTLALRVDPPARLDYGLIRKAFFVLGFVVLFLSPLVPDPVALAAGGFVPWLVLRIVSLPILPAAAVFYLLWQWLQIFTRELVACVDGEPMVRSVYGPWVSDAYWFMLAGIVTLALAFRLVLSGVRSPRASDATAHLNWRPTDLFLVYLGSFFFAIFASYAVKWLPTLYQQINAVAQFKTAALFLLFTVVLATRQGFPFLLGALGLEIMMGFSGLLGEFRAVFIILGLSAVAARIRWSGTATAIAAVWFVVLLALSIFWTAVKSDYRELATGSSDSQELEASFKDRLGYIGGRAVNVGDIDWRLASYALLIRMAYVDIFGSVIGVDKFAREPAYMRQWQDSLAHVFQPRFLFPNKPELNDTEVYIRLAHADASETVRGNTSISVGYLAENYVDLGFPGMLIGVFAIGVMMAGLTRAFLAARLPWMLREATIMAFLYTCGANGVEVSLPKIIGTAFMFSIVYALLIKFAYPTGVRWLEARAIPSLPIRARFVNRA